MKKLLLAFLLTSAFCNNSAEASVATHVSLHVPVNETTAKWALIGGAAIGSAALIYYFYNHFFNLTDAEELDRATCLCAKVTNEHEHIVFTYAPFLELLSCSITNIAKHGDTLIRNYYSTTYPYLAYADDLERTLAALNDRCEELSNCKAQVNKRKNNITTNRCSNLSPREQKYFINRYTQQETVLQKLFDALHETSTKFQQLQWNVTGLAEYKQEALLCKIDRLETQLHQATMNQHIHCYHCYQS